MVVFNITQTLNCDVDIGRDRDGGQESMGGGLLQIPVLKTSRDTHFTLLSSYFILAISTIITRETGVFFCRWWYIFDLDYYM